MSSKMSIDYVPNKESPPPPSLLFKVVWLNSKQLTVAKRKLETDYNFTSNTIPKRSIICENGIVSLILSLYISFPLTQTYTKDFMFSSISISCERMKEF